MKKIMTALLLSPFLCAQSVLAFNLPPIRVDPPKFEDIIVVIAPGPAATAAAAEAARNEIQKPERERKEAEERKNNEMRDNATKVASLEQELRGTEASRAEKIGRADEIQKSINKQLDHKKELADWIQDLTAVRTQVDEMLISTETLRIAAENIQKSLAKNIKLDRAVTQVSGQLKEKRYPQRDIRAVELLGKYLNDLPSNSLVNQALQDLSVEIGNSKAKVTQFKFSTHLGKLKNSLDKQNVTIEAGIAADTELVAKFKTEISSLDQRIANLKTDIKTLQDRMQR